MRTLTLEEVGIVAGGSFDMRSPWESTWGELREPDVIVLLNGLVAVAGTQLGGDTADKEGVTLNCTKDSSWLDCTWEKAGVIGVLSAIVTGLTALLAPPVAAALGVFTALWWSHAALSCVLHAFGDICYTSHRPFPG